MPIYKFSLAERRPELFKNCRLPSTRPIPVSYEGRMLCEITIPQDGSIELELPADLISRIEADKVMVMIDSTSLLPHDALDDFQLVRVTEIEFYDRD